MSHRYSFLLLLSLLAQLACSVSAQVGPPTILTTSLSPPAAKVGTELDVVVQAKIQPHWHLYATDFSDEVGPVVFILTFAKSPAYELMGKPQSIGSKHVHDEVFNGEVAFFENTGQIRHRIRVLRPGPLTIKAEAEYQSCSDADGRCVPGSTSLTFGPLNVAAVAPAQAKPTRSTSARTPAAAPKPGLVPPPQALLAMVVR